MKTKSLFRKILALVLVFAMLIPTMSHLATDIEEVQAADATTKVTDESVGYVIVPKESVNMEGSQPTVSGEYEDGKYSDYLFAGWYSDDKALTASVSGTYARFVPADVLSVKCQVTNGIVTDTLIDDYENKYVLRFVSSVDSLDYKNAGFVITYEEDGKIITRTNTITTGFKRIESTTGSTGKGADLYEFSPKVISTKSEYFITAKWPVDDTEQKITVKAFWTTKDGQRVYGGSRCVCVEDGLKDTTSTSVSFVSETSYEEGASIDSVTYGENKTTTAKVVGCTPYGNGGYTVHTVMEGVNRNQLPSVTKFTFGNAGSAIYRNLYTTYSGTPDTTWYDATKDEFVIASSADLYGLATVVNGGVDFANKTVYVVADIAANKGKATENGFVKDGVEAGTDFTWIPIGNSTQSFDGIFDACMHSISGVNYNDNMNQTRTGLFGRVAAGTIKNLKLENSYFCSSATQLGGLIGQLGDTGKTGTLDTVYSDAIVIGTTIGDKYGAYVGGLVGYAAYNSTVNINNCWFAGKVIENACCRGVGGIVGLSSMNTGTLTIRNCMNTGMTSSSLTQSAAKQGTGSFVGHHYGGTLTIKNIIAAPAEGYNIYQNLIVGDGAPSTISVEKLYWDFSGTPYYTSIMSPASGESIQITSSTDYSALLDAAGYWKSLKGRYPVLTSFEDMMMIPDTSWYDENKDIYVLYDAADLYGFAELSQSNSFAGKTIRLGADITVNKGNAQDWAALEPRYNWTPIGKSTAFAGTFDGSDPESGKIHTISGIYLNDTSVYSGLFGYVTSGTIKNLKLKNSYFYSTTQKLGSIVGELGTASATAILDTVYSNAIVVNTNAHTAGVFVGGLVGVAGNSAAADVDITNCWFDGTVTNDNSAFCLGGLVGLSTVKNLDIHNCMNTGLTISAQSTETSSSKAGSVVGYHYRGALSIKNVISDPTEGYDIYDNKIVGGKDSGAGTISVENLYWDATETLVDAGIMTGESVQITSNTDYSALINSGNYQTISNRLYPVLTSFASGVIVPDTSWYDANESTFTLYNAADFYGFAKLSQTNNFAGKTVKLGADITVNKGAAEDWAHSAPKYSWTPIGSKSNPFAGIFDGRMYSISGIYLNTSIDGAGLFARVVTAEGYATATVKNLKLLNSYFHSTAGTFGSISGLGDGEFNALYSDAIVVAKNTAIGGLVGGSTSSDGITIKKCWFDGTVTQEKPADYQKRGTGGIIGYVYTCINLEDCLNTGTVDTSMYDLAQNESVKTSYAGGLVGWFVTGGKLTITNCLNVGNINVNDNTTHYVGPIVGANAATTINCTGVYAIKGCCSKVKNSISYTEVDRGTITGTNALAKLTGFSADTWQALEMGTPVLKDFVDACVDTSWYNANATTYTLYDAADLYGFAELSQKNNFAGKTVRLGADIVVNEGNAKEWANNVPMYSWTPIGSSATPFAGIFDGRMYSISGIYLNTTVDYAGLFAAVATQQDTSTATVKNLKLVNSYIKSTNGIIGSIAGSGEGEFNTIYSDAIVVGDKAGIGGLIGASSTSTAGITLKQCWFNGTVTQENPSAVAHRGIGGLLGSMYNYVCLENCLNTGTVDAYNYDEAAGNGNIMAFAGGLVGAIDDGDAQLVITNCLNVGKVIVNETITHYASSIVGALNSNVKKTCSGVYAVKGCCNKPLNDAINATEVTIAEITGASALTTLTGFSADTWQALELETPILKAFADVAITNRTEKDVTLKTAIQTAYGKTTTLTMTSSVAQTLSVNTPSDKNQGSWTDGKYLYNAYITTEANNQVDNEVIVVKYDLQTGQEVKCSETLKLCHANDLTYNSKTGLLAVCHQTAGQSEVVSLIDPETMTIKETKALDVAIYCIDYNAKYDCYVVGVGDTHYIYIYNSNFKPIARYTNIKTDPQKTSGASPQGMGCDDDYIYYLFSGSYSNGYKNVITIFDWYGNYVTEIVFVQNGEPESISIVDGTIYYTIREQSDLYKLELSQ